MLQCFHYFFGANKIEKGGGSSTTINSYVTPNFRSFEEKKASRALAELDKWHPLSGPVTKCNS